MFELHNPTNSANEPMNQSGFQSLTLNYETAQITDKTYRRVEFPLSDEVELLEVRIGWIALPNPQNLGQLEVSISGYEEDYTPISNFGRPVIIPIDRYYPADQQYYMPVMTTRKAKRLIFTCNYYDVQITIISRTTFKEPE